MTFRNAFAAAFIAVSIAGCAAVSKVDKGRVTIGGAYTVQTEAEWAAIDIGNLYVWTVDGMALQELRFITAVEDGEPLFGGANADKLPKFRESMNELELLEFFQASAAAADLQSMRTSNMRPATFGGRPGFRFDFTYLNKNGLAMAGFATGAVVDRKLYMIVYVGARQHYYEKRRHEAEKVMDSARFL